MRFEVVTSEASYCRSLDIVVEHFVKCKSLLDLLGNQDRNWLFSRLLEVRAISHRYETYFFFFFELLHFHFESKSVAIKSAVKVKSI